MRTHLAIWFLLVATGCPVSAGINAEAGAIQKRLDEAKDLQKAGKGDLLPMEKDLLLLANFDGEDVVGLAGSGNFPVPLEKSHYRKGKFGRGYYFERARHNLLPPNVADVEGDISQFQAVGRGKLASVTADTAFGKRSLSAVMPAANDGFQTVPTKVTGRFLLAENKEWVLMASAYVKGAKGGKIQIEVAFDPKELESNEDKNAAPVAERIPDATEPQTIVLTGEWQRVACTASSDARLKERRARLIFRSMGPAGLKILADGFQFEQVKYYPHGHVMPTTWLPGGEDRPATSVRIESPLNEVFPVKEGTMAFWTSTPRVSNLAEVGSIYWISFGYGWTPPWGLGAYRCQAGGEGCFYFSSARGMKQLLEDEQWHHLAMTWDAAAARLYADGDPVGSFEPKQAATPRNLEICSLLLGGYLADGEAANSIMDDVALFKRKLGDEEVKKLAEGATPLRMTTAPLTFSRSARRVFYRDETKAFLEMKLSAQTPLKAPVAVDVAVGDQVFSSQTVKPGAESNEARVEFDPGKLKCGVYPCRVGAVVEGKGGYLEFPIEVVPALRYDHYMLCAWGGGGETVETRAFLKNLGFNTVDTYATNLEELGKNGFAYGWHDNFGNGIWSPQNRELAREGARKAAESRARFPNWKYCLLNSETGTGPMPDAENRKAWFDAWAQKELGFSVPEEGWKFGTAHNPDQCSFLEGEAPGENGVYKSSKGVAFLKWWNNRGAGRWRLNAEAAGEIRKIRPDVRCWTDPLRDPGQVADLDAGSTWSYQIAPELLIGEFEQSYACVRGSGKEFYPTLGMNYVNGLAEKVTEPDGVEKCLVPTADDLIQQAWLAVTQIASDGMTYWDWNGLMEGLAHTKNRYAEPGSDVKLGAALKNDLIPIGTMLKRVPNAPRPVALLLPESTLWLCAGEKTTEFGGGWGWGALPHYPNNWVCWMGSAGVPYDIVLDHNLTPGSLAKYRVIIFPLALFVHEPVYNELQAAAKAGTRIIVDRYCRQQYPNMEQWEQGYYHKLKGQEKAEVDSNENYGSDTEQALAGLAAKLAPQIEVYAKGEQGRIFYNVRESNGVKYVSVVNNLRQEGAYTEWTKDKEAKWCGKPAEFKPYGKAQRARVWVKAPAGSVVYEFTESKKLEAKVEGDRLVVDVALPPHAGRLLCVYPREMKQIQFGKDERGAAGQAVALEVRVVDAQGKNLPGRQLLQVGITDPEGKAHDESGWYRMEDGVAKVSFRPALNDLPGEWKIKVTEHTSGLTATKSVRVEAEKP